jgi:hypothetical protein
LKDHERLYVTHDLELTSIVHALKIWQDYLMGKIFELRIDHSGLKCLFGQPSLNSIKRRCLEFLTEYEFDINHIRGKERKVLIVEPLSYALILVVILAIYSFTTRHLYP